jgi:general secretion pathway protein G
MRVRHTRSAAPRGFTLIELLVVIAIIGILLALIIGAVMAVLSKPARVQDRHDISGMSNALQDFKLKFKGISYPPSRLYLSNSYANYLPGNTPAGVPPLLAQQSLKYLKRMFPNLWTNPNAVVAWDGGLGMPAAGVILEGDQCLVFFLGGIPSSDGCLGFSKNIYDPTQPGGERIKLYEFKSDRLKALHGNVFYSYLNPHDNNAKAYAYFSPGERSNGYNSLVTGLGSSDCNFTATSLGVNPYASTWPAAGQFTPTPNFISPDTFQIISAGPDGQFGSGTTSQGTVWSPANQNSTATGPAADDMSNFVGNTLGAP